MRYSQHGGRCCGIYHAYDFVDGDGSGRDLDWAIGQHDGLSNRVLEAIITDGQVAEHEPDLLAEGFVKVARWLNGNSGNYCNAYYRYKPFQGRGEIEFYGTNPQPAAPPPPPPVTVVVTEYYALRRQKGKCGPFLSPLAASQAYPNCDQFVAREILSNGQSRWGEPQNFLAGE